MLRSYAFYHRFHPANCRSGSKSSRQPGRLSTNPQWACAVSFYRSVVTQKGPLPLEAPVSNPEELTPLCEPVESHRHNGHLHICLIQRRSEQRGCQSHYCNRQITAFSSALAFSSPLYCVLIESNKKAPYFSLMPQPVHPQRISCGSVQQVKHHRPLSLYLFKQ